MELKERRWHLIIIIIDSMTSVFNTDASLPYNHDLFESLIVKKRINAIWIETDNKNATDNGWQPYLTTSPTRRSGDHAAIWIETDNKNATDNGWQPYLTTSPTRRSGDHAKLTTRTPLTTVGSHILQRLQPGAVGITRSLSWKANSTDSTQAFRNLLHTPLLGQRLATSLLTPLN
ncbi:hypothetical protein CSKR_109171 [Clonorchis sinensis]|uniref:Uncharacterized protein n=1 Tax=Clonorchis sinensis TaxID=79923 RepID=A0A3R7JUB0_CLOSI|nr:hypothetical protein CSKR_109171 [Clonorchis sinensis]